MQYFVFTRLILPTLNPFDIKRMLALYKIPSEACFPWSDGEGHPLQTADVQENRGSSKAELLKPDQVRASTGREEVT